MRDRVIYAVVLVMAAAVLTYQVRSSHDAVRVATSYDFFLPFVLQKFNNRIDNLAYGVNWESATEPDSNERFIRPHRNQLLSVEDREFRGVSVYLRGLWKLTRFSAPEIPPPESRPFTVTVRSSDLGVRRVEIGFPHCTCGAPTDFEAASTWLIPPLFCVLLGFAVVFLRPRETLAWVYLCLMLSVSQAQTWPEGYIGWQMTSTPMVWDGWFRLFGVGYRAFVQSLWPAALLLGSTHFCRSRPWPNRAATTLAGGVVLYAAVQAGLSLAWSENYRPFVPVYQFVSAYRTELIVIAMGAVVALAFMLSRAFGVGALCLALTAVTALYRTAAPITTGVWQRYSDESFRYDAIIPPFHHTPALILTLLTAGIIVWALLIYRQRVTRLEALGVATLLPIIVDFAARVGGFWYPLEPGFFRYWMWTALAPAGIGLSILARSVLQRTASVLPQKFAAELRTMPEGKWPP
jgi:hypothetical protein